MKNNLIPLILLIILLLLAVVLGKIIAAASVGNSYAFWLGAGASLSFSPLTVTLSVVSFTVDAMKHSCCPGGSAACRYRILYQIKI